MSKVDSRVELDFADGKKMKLTGFSRFAALRDADHWSKLPNVKRTRAVNYRLADGAVLEAKTFENGAMQ